MLPAYGAQCWEPFAWGANAPLPYLSHSQGTHAWRHFCFMGTHET